MHGTQSLARALAVLEAVAQGHADQASIARAVGTTRTTTHRLVSFLHRAGFLRPIEGRGFVLGARLIELGTTALIQLPLTSLARPLIERLAQQTGDAIHLSVRDGDRVMYVDKISGNKGLEMRSHVGLRKPIARTGTGKAMMLDLTEKEWARLYALAQAETITEDHPPPGFLPWDAFLTAMRDYQAKGYTMEEEENEPTICSVAAPIRDARGAIVAGLSIASARHYMPKQRMENLAPMVSACAADISRELGFTKIQ